MVYEHEKEIINTPEFQRLRRIHQLGLTHYVYHGAEHSRFGHSIGVMHLAGKLLLRIFDKNHAQICKDLQENKDALGRKLYFAARLAGLLHDLGHGPFSHTGEGKLFPEGLDHEKLDHTDYTVAAIKVSSISGIIDSYATKTGVTSNDICSIIDEKGLYSAAFIKQLISGAWDVDKMDYLLRDSHYCGVEYGRYDLERLIDCLTLDDGVQTGSLLLAIEEGGYHALEALILARYFMFTQVYFHDIRRAYDIVMTEFLKECLKRAYGSEVYPPLEQICEFLKWDDVRVLSEASSRLDVGTRNWAWRIIHRKHLKPVFSTLPHPTEIQQRRAASLLQKCQERFPDVGFWLDRAVDHPEKFNKEDIPIKVGKNNPKWPSLAEKLAALQGLKPIGQYRIYADVADNKQEVDISRSCEEFMSPVS